jgi:hypothetical protein
MILLRETKWSETKWSTRYCLRILLGVTALGGASATLAQDVISGQVRNQTLSRPAVGEPVILLGLGAEVSDRRSPERGLQEQARTQTDANGMFTFTLGHAHVPPADKPHTTSYLVRLAHQGVNYDAQVSSGGRATLDIFDAAAKVDNISGTIEIVRAGTVDKQLHVSDMIEIQNRSKPPLTQAGERTFDVYLPARAKISSVLAAGPGNTAVMISATPVPGDSGHFAVNFPLRPGATKFAFNYDIPYEGHAAFSARHAYPLQQFAVMIPPTMKFSSTSTAFKTLETGNKSYRVQAIGRLNAGPGPAFEISGKGPLPSIHETDTVAARSVAPATASPIPQGLAAVNSSPGTGPAQSSAKNHDAPSPQTRSSLSAEPSVILGISGLLLVVASAVAIRAGRTSKRTMRSQRTAGIDETRLSTTPGHGTTCNEGRGSKPLLEGLKEELFQLEAAKIGGTISTEEYDLTRCALEETVRRALRRAS